MGRTTIRAPAGKFLLKYSFYKSTTGEVSEQTVHDTEQAARNAYEEAKRRYVGYVIWTAYVYDDRGRRIVLARTQPYG